MGMVFLLWQVGLIANVKLQFLIVFIENLRSVSGSDAQFRFLDRNWFRNHFIEPTCAYILVLGHDLNILDLMQSHTTSTWLENC